MSGPLRVLLCGTVYGRFYFEAIWLRGEAYTLTGILARGSERSRELAVSAGVPLFQSVRDVSDCDMTCFAIGSSGSSIIPQLLERRIHVLCEHPRRKEDLLRALRSANDNGVCFHLNGHLGDLPAPSTFIGRVQDSGPPLCFSLIVTDRSLYGALDVIGRSLRKLAPYEFGAPSRPGAFVSVAGIVGGVPITLQIQDRSAASNSRNLREGSQEYLVDLQIAAIYPEGTLSLVSLAGPLIWNRNYNCAIGDEKLWSVVGAVPASTAQELRHHRILANCGAMDRLAQQMRGNAAPDEQQPEYMLQVTDVWELLSERLHTT